MYGWIPLPKPSALELAAIDAIRAAYLACNACDTDNSRSPLVYELSLGNGYDSEVTAMGFLAEAARTAWKQIGVIDADLWDVMQDCGENAAYVFRLYAENLL